MAATSVDAVGLAKTLPPRLLRFFKKFPPRQPPTEPIPPSTLTTTDESGKTFSITVPNNRHVTALPPFSDATFNPFLPWLNPQTQKWRPPVYSLRQQADICKMARHYGVEELLPWSRKMLLVKKAKKDQLGVRVRGTGVGQRVKGHKWERHMISTQEKRRKAMENMSNLIDEWKSVSDAEKKSWLKLSSKTNCYVERAWSQVDGVAQKDKDIDRIKGEILLTTCIICHR